MAASNKRRERRCSKKFESLANPRRLCWGRGRAQCGGEICPEEPDRVELAVYLGRGLLRKSRHKRGAILPERRSWHRLEQVEG